MKPKKNTSTQKNVNKERRDKQEDDEFCTCCEESCDCGDCRECTADAARVLPAKRRWNKAE